jgi:hypothetical protein
MKKLVLILALIVAAAGASILAVHIKDGAGDETDKAAANVSASLDRAAVAYAQEDLAAAVVKEMREGGTDGELVATKHLLRSLRGMPESYRRQEIADALDTLEKPGSSCYMCIYELVPAR